LLGRPILSFRLGTRRTATTTLGWRAAARLLGDRCGCRLSHAVASEIEDEKHDVDRVVVDVVGGKPAAWHVGVERLDIEHHGVEQLCCMGELELITDERIQATAKARHITKSSLDNLVARIKGNDAALRGDGMVVEDPVLILRAMRIVSGREKPWAAAVKAMLSGDLPSPLNGPVRDG